MQNWSTDLAGTTTAQVEAAIRATVATYVPGVAIMSVKLEHDPQSDIWLNNQLGVPNEFMHINSQIEVESTLSSADVRTSFRDGTENAMATPGSPLKELRLVRNVKTTILPKE